MHAPTGALSTAQLTYLNALGVLPEHACTVPVVVGVADHGHLAGDPGAQAAFLGTCGACRHSTAARGRWDTCGARMCHLLHRRLQLAQQVAGGPALPERSKSLAQAGAHESALFRFDGDTCGTHGSSLHCVLECGDADMLGR